MDELSSAMDSANSISRAATDVNSAAVIESVVEHAFVSVEQVLRLVWHGTARETLQMAGWLTQNANEVLFFFFALALAMAGTVNNIRCVSNVSSGFSCGTMFTR